MVLAVLAVPSLLVAQAAAVPPPSSSTTSTTPPQPPGIAGDTVRVYQTRELSSAARQATIAAAAAVGGRAAVFEGGTIGISRVMRGGTIVQAARPGYRFPASMSGVSVADARSLYGFTIARALAHGEVVMSKRSADRRGARIGDTVSLVGWNNGVRRVRLGAISDALHSEVLVSVSLAQRLGVNRDSFVLIWGFEDREAILSALAERSAALGRHRALGSWMNDPADDTLSSEGLKEELGEFAITGDRSIRVDPAWTKANLTTVRWRVGNRTVSKVCHRVVAAASEAVFDHITDAGLDGYIDVEVTRSSGGCFLARVVRSIGSTSGRNLSTHTWGAAIDINTKANCLGCKPVIACEIVQIFRSHGFAWGGNFLTPDGMHFEWVGEARDQTPTRPGEYCPSPAAVPSTTSPPLPG